MTIGVLVMAYGTPTTPQRRRGLLHPNSTRPTTDARTTGRPATPLQRHRRHVAAGATQRRPSGRDRRGARAPSARRIRRSLRLEVRAAATRDDGRIVSRRGLRRRWSDWSSRPIRRRCQPTSTCPGPERHSAPTSDSSTSARGGSSRVSSRSSPNGCTTRSRLSPTNDAARPR